MNMCNSLGISQDYGICGAFLRLKRWAIVVCPYGTQLPGQARLVIPLHERRMRQAIFPRTVSHRYEQRSSDWRAQG